MVHDWHGHSFGLDKVAIVLGDLVVFKHGLGSFVEEFVDFDALLGRCLDEEGAIDWLHELKALLGLHLALEIALGGNDEHEGLVAALLVELLQPLL